MFSDIHVICRTKKIIKLINLTPCKAINFGNMFNIIIRLMLTNSRNCLCRFLFVTHSYEVICLPVHQIIYVKNVSLFTIYKFSFRLYVINAVQCMPEVFPFKFMSNFGILPVCTEFETISFINVIQHIGVIRNKMRNKHKTGCQNKVARTLLTW